MVPLLFKNGIMKKILFLLSIIFSVLIISCNNNAEQDDPEAKANPQADSLMADVMDGHDDGMAKMGKIRSMRAEISRLIDSIQTLPAKAKDAAGPLRSRLDSIAADLSNAETAMDKWMTEFDMDSAKNNAEKRIQYLLDEKIKVSKVKEAISNGLRKADSVLKARF